MVLPVVALLSGQLSQLRLDRRRQKAELRDALERLRLVATRDELTGLPNRRYMQEWVTQEISRAGRTGNSTCLTLIDLDHFKQVNDRFGHAVGDAALRILAREARTVLREADLLARWGGEEFLLVMPDATPANALLALDRLRARFEDPLTWAECPQAQVRFSAGLTALRAGEVFEIAVRRADAALYDAKRAGRNCTVLATFEPTEPADALPVTGTATPEAAAP
jgi:diguanylate cyclase (GGDEF)-like protein